jgi:hypothetical protein
MTSPSCCRVPALAWFSVLPVLALSGCGGVGSAGTDAANAVVDGLVCGLRNCTESSTLNIDEISPRFTATQAAGDGAVEVAGGLGKSANVFTSVLMARDESLTVSVDGSPELPMPNPDGKRLSYEARLAAASAQPVVRVVFTRGGTRHVNQVTLPPGFTVLQPTGAPLLTRSGNALPVRLSAAPTGSLYAGANGSCGRADASSFELNAAPLTTRPEPGVAGGYRLEPAVVDDNLNAYSQSLNQNDPRTAAVTRCDLVVTWSMEVTGSVAPTMNRHGAFVGRRTATHRLSYDARL